MKRFFCTVLSIIIVFSVLAVPVFGAEQDPISYIPKMESGASIALDGERDSAYNSARVIYVDQQIVSYDSALTAFAEIAWDGQYVYAYVTVSDFEFIPLPDETTPWISDSVELFLYKGQSAPSTDAVEQFRIDAEGNLTYYTGHGASPVQYFGEEVTQFEGVAVVDDLFDMGYTVEYKIPYSLAEGDKFYFQITVNSLSEGVSDQVVIGNKEALHSFQTDGFDSLVCCVPYSELPEIAEINEDIAAIGTVTRENYAEKMELINAAVEKSSELYEKYGDNVIYNYNSQGLYLAESLASLYSFYGEITFGDINGDGRTTAADALLILQYSVMKIELDENQYFLADVNSDYEVTAVDALFVLQYAVQKVGAFPADINLPLAEFVLQISAVFSSSEGMTLTCYGEGYETAEARTLYKMCLTENGLAVSIKPEGDDGFEQRILIKEEGLYILDFSDKTYAFISGEDIDESFLDDLLGNIVSGSAGHGYYQGRPAIKAEIKIDDTDIPELGFEGTVNVLGAIMLQQDGNLALIFSVKDEDGGILAYQKITGITCLPGVDSTLFEIPNDFVLADTNTD